MPLDIQHLGYICQSFFLWLLHVFYCVTSSECHLRVSVSKQLGDHLILGPKYVKVIHFQLYIYPHCLSLRLSQRWLRRILSSRI
jgi:hypothetical protein